MGRRLQIRVVDIAKEFGRTGALRGVNLDIRDGELIALLGPSGSGKTTLLRVIAGLEAPSAGKVYFDGEDATAVPVQRRRRVRIPELCPVQAHVGCGQYRLRPTGPSAW
jgi:sulfate transport system ATP-binding protein